VDPAAASYLYCDMTYVVLRLLIMRRRLAYSAVAILHALANGHRHGFDIIASTGLTSATVYPTLGKLESAGFVSSAWELPNTAQKAKRPPRRYYELRPAGKRALAESLDRFRVLQSVPRRLLPKPERP
jgi:PadR family transcriptional regulator PadR